jgi:hypothetical protein
MASTIFAKPGTGKPGPAAKIPPPPPETPEITRFGK